MPSNHLLCCPLLHLPSIFPSIKVFSNDSALRIRWPKHWSFSFSISPSNKYSGLISFKRDWFDLLAVQGTLKSRLHIRKHQFFDTQPSFCPALTSLWLLTGKTIAWLDGPLSAKWSQLFHTQSRSVTAFPPRSKCPLISQLQSPSAAILEPKKIKSVTTSFFQFSRSIMSNSLRPHGRLHTRPPCPSPTPRACSNSCPSSWCCHPTISSSLVPFSSHLQSFPASGSSPMSQFFASGGQSTGVSASASVLPINIQDWSPLGWTGWISLQSKGLSRVFSNTTIQTH